MKKFVVDYLACKSVNDKISFCGARGRDRGRQQSVAPVSAVLLLFLDIIKELRTDTVT